MYCWTADRAQKKKVPLDNVPSIYETISNFPMIKCYHNKVKNNVQNSERYFFACKWAARDVFDESFEKLFLLITIFIETRGPRV